MPSSTVEQTETETETKTKTETETKTKTETEVETKTKTETETKTKTETALITNSQVLNTVYSSVSICVNLAMFERIGLPIRKVVR